MSRVDVLIACVRVLICDSKVKQDIYFSWMFVGQEIGNSIQALGLCPLSCFYSPELLYSLSANPSLACPDPIKNVIL